MRARFAAGDAVQTPFGKGVVREVRNGGRLLVEVAGRGLEIADADVAPLTTPPGSRPARRPPTVESHVSPAPRHDVPAEIDLHGLTVEEALARAEAALNDALLADLAHVRFVHGRGGGRIRAALHRRLREIPSVQRFLLDPRNEGVTIVEL
jgi:dsDNA-specific endonuclease/ATPase MutS2